MIFLLLFIALIPGLASAQTSAVIPNGIYMRADMIKEGERGQVCLCKGEYKATEKAKRVIPVPKNVPAPPSMPELEVIEITAAPAERKSEIGRLFKPEPRERLKDDPIPYE